MPGTYNLSPRTVGDDQTLTASGHSLTETFSAALTGLLAATNALADRSDNDATAVAVPIRGEGPSPAPLFEDLAADLLIRIELDGGTYAPVELDGAIKTDDGLSVWGYLHGHSAVRPSSVRLQMRETPVIETNDRGDVVGLSLQLRVVSTKDQTSS